MKQPVCVGLAVSSNDITPEPGQSSELELILRNRVPFEKLIVAVRDNIFFFFVFCEIRSFITVVARAGSWFLS